MNDEEFVREHWELVDFSDGPYTAVVYRHDEDTIETIHGLGSGEHAQSAWFAAAEFTRKRLEEIRQLREEIEVVGKAATVFPFYADRCSRILARLERELGELTKGMKINGT